MKGDSLKALTSMGFSGRECLSDSLSCLVQTTPNAVLSLNSLSMWLPISSFLLCLPCLNLPMKICTPPWYPGRPQETMPLVSLLFTTTKVYLELCCPVPQFYVHLKKEKLVKSSCWSKF